MAIVRPPDGATIDEPTVQGMAKEAVSKVEKGTDFRVW